MSTNTTATNSTTPTSTPSAYIATTAAPSEPIATPIVSSCNCNSAECSNKNNGEQVTIKLLTQLDEVNPGNDFTKYLEEYAKAYKEIRPDINIEVSGVEGRLMLEDDLIELARTQDSEYSGFVMPAQITGDLVQYDGLWDLTDFVRSDETLLWPDFLAFYRERLAVYNNRAKLIPLDGDFFLMYYRKDLFAAFNRTVPRTWDEYSVEAKFFNARTTMPDGVTPISNQVDEEGKPKAISGSCVGRLPKCANAFWTTMVLTTMTQYGGTDTGGLFNPENMEPLLGDAFPETLRHMANQVRFTNTNEFESCLRISDNFSNGECALTYNFGNQINELLGSFVEDKMGVSRTPGSTHVMNRETKKLEPCTEELCPFGETFEDIGRVNYSPYAAFGGWVAGVSNFVGDREKKAAAEFFSYLSNAAQSINDVIPTATSLTEIRFAQPYRLSHLITEEWVERDYPPEFSEDYTNAIRDVDTFNTVIELRIPEASELRGEIDKHVVDYLMGIRDGTGDIGLASRKNVTKYLNDDLNAIVTSYDAVNDPEDQLLYQYQKSLGVFVDNANDKNLIGPEMRYTGWAIAALVVATSIGFAVWTFVNRTNRVVRASQPFILIMVCISAAIMSSTIVLVSVDDEWASVEVCDWACMSTPWVYCTGFVVLFSALFSKTWRNKQILDNPDKFTRLKVPREDFAKQFVRLYAVNVAILLTWTLHTPLTWDRKAVSDTPDDFEFDNSPPDTYGTCSGEDSAIYFAGSLAGVNVMAMVFAIAVAVQCRFISLEYDENKWIPIAMVGFIEVWVVSIPILILIYQSKNTQAMFMLQVGTVFTTSFFPLLVFFVPKLRYMLDNKSSSNSNSHSSTPGSSFYSQQSFYGTPTGITSGSNAHPNSGSSPPSNFPNLNNSAQVPSPGERIPRRSFYGGLKIMAHPRTEDVQVVRLKARLEILQIGNEDMQERIEEEIQARQMNMSPEDVYAGVVAGPNVEVTRDSLSRRVVFIDNTPLSSKNEEKQPEQEDSEQGSAIGYAVIS